MASFSAFKNYTFNQELTKLLLDVDGEVRSRSDFIKEAQKLNEAFNIRYLKTEYDQAVGSANMAAKWQDFQRRKDLYPNLRYETVGDERVRELHRKWDGIVLPIDHPFWNTHYPPNDWGCRCDVVQTDEDEFIPEDERGIPVPVDDMPALPKMFNINSGKQGVVFDEEHPYFQWNDPAIKRLLEQYKLNFPNYRETPTKGLRISAFAHIQDLTNNIRIAELLIKKLKVKIDIRPHVNNIKTGIGKKGFSNPEFLLNGKYADVKEFTGKEIKSIFKLAKDQGNKVLIIENQSSIPKGRLFEMIKGQITIRDGYNPFDKIYVIDKKGNIVAYK